MNIIINTFIIITIIKNMIIKWKKIAERLSPSWLSPWHWPTSRSSWSSSKEMAKRSSPADRKNWNQAPVHFDLFKQIINNDLDNDRDLLCFLWWWQWWFLAFQRIMNNDLDDHHDEDYDRDYDAIVAVGIILTFSNNYQYHY